MGKKLPLYKLVINDTEESGVDMVSFVASPAIEEEFMVFEKDEFKLNPDSGESKDDYLKRCIPHEIGKGHPQDQAVAMCSSIYDNAFSSKFATDAKRRIVTGAMMIPDKPIYRNNDGEEFMVVFDKDTIEKIAQKFFKNNYSNNVNIDHSTQVNGVYMFESFITDKQRGIMPPKNYSKVPDGSWFASYKIDNEEVWQSVENGTFKGFSVEGMFNKVPVKMSKTNTEIEIDNLFKDLY